MYSYIYFQNARIIGYVLIYLVLGINHRALGMLITELHPQAPLLCVYIYLYFESMKKRGGKGLITSLQSSDKVISTAFTSASGFQEPSEVISFNF